MKSDLRWMRVAILFGVATAVHPAVAAPGAKRAFDIALVYQKSFDQVRSALREVGGIQRSVGKENSFVEYALPSVGVQVVFRNKKSSIVTVQFRRPMAQPQDALAAIGLKAKGRKPDVAKAVTCRWTNLGGVKLVTVRSSDGVHWDSIEARSY